jgi:5-keto-L-gluconate epimerase
MKRLILASDQMGYPLKQAIKKLLEERGIDHHDAGPYSDEFAVDYPDYIQPAAQAVAEAQFEGGIVICGTGLGASIAANKVPGVRAVLCTDVYTAHQGRAHNDSNVLALGAWVVSPQRAIGIVEEWLSTPFDGGRHIPRLAKLEKNLVSGESFYRKESGLPKFDPHEYSGKFSVAVTIQESNFGPVMYGGRFEQGLMEIAAAGFRKIEISMRNSDDLPRERIRELLEHYGLKISAIATGQGCGMDGLCLSSTDKVVQKAAVLRMQSLIDLAEWFNSVPVILGGVRGRFAGSLEDQTLQRSMAVEAMRVCVRYAAERGVNTLLEPINRYETNFINTIEDGLTLQDEIGESSMKLLADTFHMNIEEADILASFKEAGEKIGYVHFADNNRLAPGQGHIDFRAILKLLQIEGYKGDIGIEVLPLPDDISAVQMASEYLKMLLGGI